MPNGKTPKELGYETQDVGWPFVLWSLGILTVLTIVSVFTLLWLFSARDKVTSVGAMPDVATAEERPVPTGPLLQQLPPLDMKAYKAEALAHLNGYGWIDEASGKVHVPIDRAIEMALEQGFASGTPALAVEETPADEEAP